MIKQILSIAGRPGLYKLVSQGKNMLIVESLSDRKRLPAYARDKVTSLGDISIYTLEDDEPLPNVLQTLKEKTGAKEVDVKAIPDLREYFAEILPAFDRDRVHLSDIRKLLSWYNLLIATGEDTFVEETAEETPAEESPAEDAPAE